MIKNTEIINIVQSLLINRHFFHGKERKTVLLEDPKEWSLTRVSTGPSPVQYLHGRLANLSKPAVFHLRRRPLWQPKPKSSRLSKGGSVKPWNRFCHTETCGFPNPTQSRLKCVVFTKITSKPRES